VDGTQVRMAMMDGMMVLFYLKLELQQHLHWEAK
jgi:hypothetical protein